MIKLALIGIEMSNFRKISTPLIIVLCAGFFLNSSLVFAQPLSNAIISQTQPAGQNDAVNQLIKLKTENAQLSQEVQKLDIRLGSVDKDLTGLENKIVDTEFELNAKEKILNKRAQAIYKNKSSGLTLDLLLGASNLYDFITRLNFFGLIIKQDSDILKDVKHKKTMLYDMKNQFLAKRQKIVVLKKEKEASVASLRDVSQRLQQRLASVTQKQKVEASNWLGLAKRIDEYLQTKGSPIAGYGEAFVTSGRQYNINPRLIVAISGVESSFGLYNAGPYNAWGRKAPGGGWRSWSSWQEAIADQAQYLREKYLNEGLTSVEQISVKYCPPTSSSWAGKVQNFMQQI